MRLQAYVFCGCYERGLVKCPPPDPEIVGVSTNGDVGCHRPTPVQYQAFLKWRYRACHHRDGLITGGLLGHRLPVEIMHKAMLPHRRTFPLFVRKVLGCKPQTRFSPLTVRQVSVLTIDTFVGWSQHLGMSRQLPIEYPGAIYHVMSRGNRRERIFRDETDRRLFLAALEAAVGKTQWRVVGHASVSPHY